MKTPASPRQFQSLLTTTCIALLATCAAGARPGGYGGAPGPTMGGPFGRNPQPVTQVLKFVSSRQGTIGGHKHIIATFSPLTGSGAAQLMVPNKDPNSSEPNKELATYINGLKPGDVVRVDFMPANGMPEIKSIQSIEVKPGEENPHVYEFIETYNDRTSGAPVISLNKYGQEVDFGVPTVRGQQGKMEPDQKIIDSANQFKKGDMVYLQVQTASRSPLVTAIYPYSAPKTGKLTKVTEQDVNGQKAKAVEIEGTDGKTVIALVPGKEVNKRWVPDPQLLRAVLALRPKTDVEFLTHPEGDQTVLTDITRAAPAPREKPERMEKPAKGQP